MDATILVAGTFDILHAGHYQLLHAAFCSGRAVEVWLADDAMCQAKAQRCGQALQPFANRAAGVQAWLDAQTPASIALGAGQLQDHPGGGGGGGGSAGPEHPYRGRYTLHALADPLGPAATEARYTAIVCSEETRQGCEAINAARVARGLAPLRLVVVPLVCAPGGAKLSSTEERRKLAQGAGAGTV
jgi:phosphopantetheine adenylyltransferase